MESKIAAGLDPTASPRIVAMREADFRREADAVRSQTSNYRWMAKLLRIRSRAIGGWFPHKLHAFLRKFGNAAKPNFICEYPNGLRFLGDYRDVNSMSYALDALQTADPLHEILSLLENRPGAFIDVGANLGLYSAAMALAFPDRQVYAFEPVPATVRRAAVTFALNKLSNVALIAAAAGDTDSEIVFYDAPGCSEYASAIPTDQPIHVQWKETRVPCVRLDTVAPDLGIDQIALLKIDAEGYEPKVIAGAEALIRSAAPNIVYEYNNSVAPKAGWNASDVAMHIQSLGRYRFYQLRGADERRPFVPPEELQGLSNIFCQSI